MIKLYNSLTNQLQQFKPIKPGRAAVYTCGPTVYDHVHIGNLRAFIFADALVRTLRANNYDVAHVMNITDIDDKMITRSHEQFPGAEPESARQQLARRYEPLFLAAAKQVGIDLSQTQRPRATAEISDIQQLIGKLLKKGLAYSADDGIYFDLSKYMASHDYGLLANIDTSHQQQRVAADEYDKDQATDFALWKAAKPGEPSWPFKAGGIDMPGRPGWHIECSAMATHYLGQPFDIHTGGVDLKFPHHENEIAQSRAAAGRDLANYFVHNEHMLVDGVKMSKRHGNFVTVGDIQAKGFDPLAFRLLVLQSHYRHQQNFTWEALAGAQSFLQRLRAMADRRFQPCQQTDSHAQLVKQFKSYYDRLLANFANDLDTPHGLAVLGELADYIDTITITGDTLEVFGGTLKFIDALCGLNLSARKELAESHQQLLNRRDAARDQGDYQTADQLRSRLQKAGIGLNDTPHGTYWFRLAD